MTAPEALPEPDFSFDCDQTPCYYAETLKAYGDARAKAARMEAITVSPVILFEHEDGRYAVAAEGLQDFTNGDPKWHRLGPVEVVRLGGKGAA